jgi:hypothetical protein
MTRLTIPLMAGLLWAGASCALARDLASDDPARIALVALARHAPSTGIPAGAPLSLRRVWRDGDQAQVCGLAMSRDGHLLMDKGQLHLKRVYLHKRGSRWAVTRAERLDLAPQASVEPLCGGAAAANEATMVAAIREMEMNPPTAGQATDRPARADLDARANPDCAQIQPSAMADAPGSPGVVDRPGRSLLHTAPDLHCRMGKHLVGGDKVMILKQVAGWTEVSYTHPITGVTTIGWLTRPRVKALDATDDTRAAEALAATAMATTTEAEAQR